MQEIARGALNKMTARLIEPVEYHLPIGTQQVHLNPLIGQPIKLSFLGKIDCSSCGKKTNKSFGQGYCYQCFSKLPQCDQCMMAPEKCHFAAGSCRDERWAHKFCFNEHYVYLANSSGVKVGITRGTQVPTRWIDQGAVQALPILKVSTRFQSGQAERIFANHITDKTNWRAMLKGQVDTVDLFKSRDRLFELCRDELTELTCLHGIQSIRELPQAEQIDISYPVLEYPVKVSSLNFDKTADVEGRLMGIKGQYLILDTGVINIRKFTSYQVAISA